LAVAAEHEVAEMREEAGFGRREEAIGDGDGEFGEDATDFAGGDQGAARGDEFAGEIGGTKAAVRGVGMGVAKAVAVGVSGEGASASIGELKLATVVRGGMFRIHGRIVTLCAYICLVTECNIAGDSLWEMFRMAEVSVRIGSGAGWGRGGG